MKSPIRLRLLVIAVLGVGTAALSGMTLYRAISASNATRVERARDAVSTEVSRLAVEGPDATAAPPTIVGLRGGIARDAATIARGIPDDWRAPLAEFLDSLTVAGTPDRDIDLAIPGAHLVARVRRLSPERLAWAAIVVRPSPYLRSWRILVVALVTSTLLLLGNAIWALLSVGRAARGLHGYLGSLARDLAAPPPRSEVRELGDIAEGIATLARRLAESRQIQERLGRDLARQERLAALGRVAAGVAHEVRNPLASIKLRLDLALSSEAPDAMGVSSPVARQAIAHASSEITRLDRLVADLLIVSGRLPAARQPIDVAELARQRAEALRPWAALRGVELVVTGVGNTEGDLDAIARAMDNLVRNAVDASPDGGRVEVRVGTTAETVLLTVEDRGPGVAAARSAELFEPFFTTKPEGTGLGLAISRAVARAHGGDVTYVRDGERTRFELTVPRSTTAQPEAAGTGAGAERAS